MSAILYLQNPCKLPMSFRCIKAFMHAFSGWFYRTCLEGISFKFFVCFILNVSIGNAPKRKNFDIHRNTRVGSGCQFTSNLLSCRLTLIRELICLKALNTLITPWGRFGILKENNSKHPKGCVLLSGLFPRKYWPNLPLKLSLAGSNNQCIERYFPCHLFVSYS